MPNGNVNILSFAMLRDSGLNVEYFYEYDEFHVTMNGSKMIFERCGKLYKHVVSDDALEELYGYTPYTHHIILPTRQRSLRACTVFRTF